MQITVNEKIYTIEFTFEAAISDNIQIVFDYFTGVYMFNGVKETDDELEKRIAQTNALLSGIAKAPKMAVELFYLGLLENHIDEIKTFKDASNLYKNFCKENPDSELAMHSGLFDALKGQMESDGFFKRIGLEQMMESMAQTPIPKEPQDHKRKANRKA